MTSRRLPRPDEDRVIGTDFRRVAPTSCAVPLVRIDALGNIRSGNAAFGDLIGLSEGELEWLDWSRVIHPDDVAAFFGAIGRAGQVGAAQRLEHLVRRFDGAWVWVLSLIEASPSSSDDVEGLTVAITDIGRTKALEEKVITLSSRDPLTGLTNRAGTLDAMADALRDGEPDSEVLVAVLDLDRFAAVNASLGHEAGDVILALVAERLGSEWDDGEVVGRVGDDEFVICQVGGRPEIAGFVSRIEGVFAPPFVIGGVSTHLDASVGVVFETGTKWSAERLLARAEDAVRTAKRAPGTVVKLFDAARASDRSVRCELELEIASAVLPDPLVIQYQPIVSVSSGHLVSVEALVRWRHPIRGLIGPDEFIEMAERAGRMSTITHWMLDAACSQISRWDRHGGLNAPAVAVNAAASDIVDPDFVRIVEQVLDRNRIDPARLHIELTESSFLEDEEAAVATLTGLAAAGIAISLDDFGTGYSSLSYLTNLPVSTVKIDRSFVQAIEGDPLCVSGRRARAAIRGLTRLSHSLGHEVIAEGVETPESCAIVAELGCDFTQGFLHAPPLDADDQRLLDLLSWSA